MARKLRVEYPGAVYHVMNRGDRREPIYADDQDRLLFLDTLAEACGKTDWQVHAWCLMSNHFHLVIETPRGNLVQGMVSKAQRIAQEELTALGWAAGELQGRRKSDPQKVRIASRLRRETTMTLEWIADRLCMGAATHVASLLQRHSRKGPSSEETLF